MAFIVKLSTLYIGQGLASVLEVYKNAMGAPDPAVDVPDYFGIIDYGSWVEAHSSSANTYVKGILNRAMAPNIDFVYISHLDADHYNCIKKLGDPAKKVNIERIIVGGVPISSYYDWGPDPAKPTKNIWLTKAAPNPYTNITAIIDDFTSDPGFTFNYYGPIGSAAAPRPPFNLLAEPVLPAAPHPPLIAWFPNGYIHGARGLLPGIPLDSLSSFLYQLDTNYFLSGVTLLAQEHLVGYTPPDLDKFGAHSSTKGTFINRGSIMLLISIINAANPAACKTEAVFLLTGDATSETLARFYGEGYDFRGGGFRYTTIPHHGSEDSIIHRKRDAPLGSTDEEWAYAKLFANNYGAHAAVVSAYYDGNAFHLPRRSTVEGVFSDSLVSAGAPPITLHRTLTWYKDDSDDWCRERYGGVNEHLYTTVYDKRKIGGGYGSKARNVSVIYTSGAASPVSVSITPD